MADQRAADRHERFVDVGSPVIAARESAVVVQPGERALDHPALDAQPGAVRGLTLGDLRPDPTGAKLGAMAAAVIGAIGDDGPGPELPVRADRGDAIDQRAAG